MPALNELNDDDGSRFMGGHTVESSARRTRRRLERAGFRANQTEALVEMITSREERLATKDDLADVRTELKRDIAEVREELGHLTATVANSTTRIEGLERAMEALRQEVRDRFESFRREIAGQLDGMRGQLNGMQGQIDGLRGELRMVKWILGGMLALMVPMLGGIIGIALQLAQR